MIDFVTLAIVQKKRKKKDLLMDRFWKLCRLQENK